MQIAESEAELVLAVFRLWGSLPGEAVRLKAIVALFVREQLTARDVSAGLNQAMENGWVESAGTDRYRLTAAGYDILMR